jgi:hypothetical protein
VNAVIVMPTLLMDSERFWAVTTISSRPTRPSSAGADAVGVTPVAVEPSPSPALCAGAGKANTETHVSHAMHHSVRIIGCPLLEDHRSLWTIAGNATTFLTTLSIKEFKKVTNVR